MINSYIENLLVLLIPTSLELFEALTCYNIFPKFYNIDLLKNNQTIGSFMKYLKEKKFTKPTRFSINKQLNEAYIYLPCNDNILSNHTPLNLFTLFQYYNTPLRTFTNLITPNFDDNLNILNSTTNFSNNSNSQTITNTNTNNTNYVEDQSYDGQNQRTGQALDSCTTVKTGYTASDSTEVSPYPSAPNTSSHAEGITCFNLFLLTNNLPLLTQNETLGSLLNHLQNLLFSQQLW